MPKITKEEIDSIKKEYAKEKSVVALAKEFKRRPENIIKALGTDYILRRRPSKYRNFDYEVCGNYACLFIQDNTGTLHTVLVDLADLVTITAREFVWCAIPQGDLWRICDCNGETFVYMHRLIMKAPKRSYVDHINGNPLDNRKENLRVTSNKGNTQNRINKAKHNTSGITGVSWDKSMQKWESCICVDYKKKHLGYFSCTKEAEQAYKAAKIKYHPTSKEAREALNV